VNPFSPPLIRPPAPPGRCRARLASRRGRAALNNGPQHQPSPLCTGPSPVLLQRMAGNANFGPLRADLVLEAVALFQPYALSPASRQKGSSGSSGSPAPLAVLLCLVCRYRVCVDHVTRHLSDSTSHTCALLVVSGRSCRSASRMRALTH
jgi:hypothetical protein